MSPQEIIKSKDFIQEQLEQTTQDLFNARSVKEIQFLQQKIIYLKQKIREAKKLKK
jgi:hypothetical protein